MAIENRGYLGDFIKGMSSKFAEVFDQADQSYSLAINDAVATVGNKRSRLFREKTTSAARERTASKSGLGYLQETPEGQGYANDARVPGYTTTWIPIKFTSGVTVTEEAIEDRDYESQLDEFSDLVVAGKESMDKDAFSLFNYGFTLQALVPGRYSQYGDAKPMFSTSHPLKSSRTSTTTFSNASSTGIPFSEANLEVARLALMNQLDDAGKPMNVGLGKLILLVAPTNEKAAVIATKGEKRSGTANNDINIYDGIMTVISSQYLSTLHGGLNTQWILIDPKVAKLVFMLRRALRRDRSVDNNTKSVKFDISARWTVGYGDSRGTWASKGDLAAYSD